MANSFTMLADLRAGRCSTTAEVRLLRFWEARNIKRGGELMGVDMLLIDEQSTLMQALVSVNRLGIFRGRLIAGSVYTLIGFDVTRSNNNFRLSDSPHAIRFNESTVLTEMTDTGKPIPREFFCFRSYDELLALANTNRQLPDVIGEVSAIRSTINERLQGSQRVMLTLRLESNVNVVVSMFDSLAHAFHTKFVSHGSEPRIVVATSINPKIVGGRLYLNTTSATHLYFDSETADGKKMFDELTLSGTALTATSSKVVHAQKIEPHTVSELNEYVIKVDPQVVEFLCTAKVNEIHGDKGWCYIGCSTCSKKLLREISSFTCAVCNKNDAVGVLRYRVELSVADLSGSAVFVAFDEEVAKITNIPAAEAAYIVGVGVDAKIDRDLPRFFADMIGTTYTFQLRLTDFNFTSKHHAFIVSRMFSVKERVPVPAFVVDPSTTVAELSGGDAPGSVGEGEVGSSVEGLPDVPVDTPSVAAESGAKKPRLE